MEKAHWCDVVIPMDNICQKLTNAVSFIMFRIGIPALDYLDDLVSADKEE